MRGRAEARLNGGEPFEDCHGAAALWAKPLRPRHVRRLEFEAALGDSQQVYRDFSSFAMELQPNPLFKGLSQHGPVHHLLVTASPAFALIW